MIYKFLNRDNGNTDADYMEVSNEANVAYITIGKQDENIEEFIQITLKSEDVDDLIDVLNRIKKDIENFDTGVPL
ncbi:hypothetical protein [Chryseobacterium sp. EO14]|uniref:hypothetical protein n=1 Tax=Chryseobacterium sp. EO14 TaxID=2950551 RepID=UPI00210EFE54|nr:hypothetical protein [Chryseobacterium sp. EO14]MCQ4139853.1 hypothetical protein [Chryseobacterium sp. EO14]